MAEHHVLRLHGLIACKSTLVYWGEEKKVGRGLWREESTWIGMGWVATGRR